MNADSVALHHFIGVFDLVASVICKSGRYLGVGPCIKLEGRFASDRLS